MDATLAMLEGGDRRFAVRWNAMEQDRVAEAAARIVRLLRDLTEPKGDAR